MNSKNGVIHSHVQKRQLAMDEFKVMFAPQQSLKPDTETVKVAYFTAVNTTIFMDFIYRLCFSQTLCFENWMFPSSGKKFVSERNLDSSQCP
jgi:hypothetical protein